MCGDLSVVRSPLGWRRRLYLAECVRGGFIEGHDGDSLEDRRCLLPGGIGCVAFGETGLQLTEGDGRHHEVSGLALVETLIEMCIASLDGVDADVRIEHVLHLGASTVVVPGTPNRATPSGAALGDSSRSTALALETPRRGR